MDYLHDVFCVPENEIRLRFNAKWMPEPNSGCWIWTGSLSNSGYARLSSFHSSALNRRFVKAHRVAWILFRGEIPGGLCVLHKCDTPSCVNPNHLFLGTRGDNTADMDRKNRRVVCMGENHPCTKLSDNDVRSIRKDSRSSCKIAPEYGVEPVYNPAN